MVRSLGTVGTVIGPDQYSQMSSYLDTVAICAPSLVWAYIVSFELRQTSAWMESSNASTLAGPPAKRMKVRGTSDVPPPVPDGVSLPANYKVRRCRYCRQWSLELCQWELAGTVLAEWAPLIPWNRGCMSKPSGDLCKVCHIVPGSILTMWTMHMVFKKNCLA